MPVILSVVKKIVQLKTDVFFHKILPLEGYAQRNKNG